MLIYTLTNIGMYNFFYKMSTLGKLSYSKNNNKGSIKHEWNFNHCKWDLNQYRWTSVHCAWTLVCCEWNKRKEVSEG